MKNKFNHIQDLCRKYDAGKTSLKEELELEQFFKENSNIPDEFSSYAVEFGYYASSKNLTVPKNLLVDISLPKHSLWSKIKDFFLSAAGITTAVLSIVGMLVWYYATEPNVQEITLDKVSTEEPTALKPEKIVSLDDTLKVEDNTPITPEYTPEKQVVKKNEELSDSIQKDTVSLPYPNTDLVTQHPDSRANAVQKNPIKPPFQKPIEKKTIQEGIETRFTITQNSSSSELARIARLANEAGIEYTYVVDMRKKLIHELNIVMVIRSTGERSQLWIAYPKKTSVFSEVIGWNTDEDGMATSLSKSKIKHVVKPKHPLD